VQLKKNIQTTVACAPQHTRCKQGSHYLNISSLFSSFATFQPAVTLCTLLLLLLLWYAGFRVLPAAAGVLPVG
jgi:hypothetical protein